MPRPFNFKTRTEDNEGEKVRLNLRNVKKRLERFEEMLNSRKRKEKREESLQVQVEEKTSVSGSLGMQVRQK